MNYLYDSKKYYGMRLLLLSSVNRHHGFRAITLYYVTDPSQTQGSLAQNNASD